MQDVLFVGKIQNGDTLTVHDLLYSGEDSLETYQKIKVWLPNRALCGVDKTEFMVDILPLSKFRDTLM